MQYKPKPIAIQFKTVSPVFVGNGEEVTPLSFLTDHDTVYVLDETKFFAALSPKEQEYYLNWIDPILTGIERANERKQRSRNDKAAKREAQTELKKFKAQLSVEEFIKRRIRVNNPVKFIQQTGCVAHQVKKGTNPGPNGYKTCLKNPQNQPYLPGTEIKGSLRTALLFALLEDEANYQTLKQSIQRLRSTANRRWEMEKLLPRVIQETEEKLFRGQKNDAKYDLLRLLRVSDSTSASTDCLKLELSQSLGTAKNTKTVIETLQLPDDETGEFRVEVMDNQPELLKELELSGLVSLNFLLESCYKHSAAILQTEIEYFQENHQSKLAQKATKLLRKNTPQKPLLRLGSGQGQLSITIISWLWARDPDLYEIYRQAVSTMRGWRNTVKDNFPKTRRVIHHDKNPTEMLGWIQLIPPADKQIQGSIEFNFASAKSSEPDSTPQTGRQRGRVTFFNDTKGFGFIKPESGNDIFVHITEVQGGVLTENDNVTFEIGPGRKGPQAINVKRE